MVMWQSSNWDWDQNKVKNISRNYFLFPPVLAWCVVAGCPGRSRVERWGVTLHFGVGFPPTADIHYSVPAPRVNIPVLGLDTDLICVNTSAVYTESGLYLLVKHGNHGYITH